jgi:hypothetical protein
MYSCYHSAAYDRWKDILVPVILRYQSEMAGLNRQTIIDHDQLAEEVSVTTYADGTKVYVNYSSQDFRKNGVVIPARDYLVKRGKGQ